MKNNLRIWLVLWGIFAACVNTLQGQSLLDEEVANLHYFTPSPEKVVTPYLLRNTPQVWQAHPEFGRQPFNASTGGYLELIHERTIDSRLFVKRGSHGKQFVRQQSFGAIHYQKDGRWTTIDKRLHPVPGKANVFAAMQQPIPTRIDLQKGTLALRLSTGDWYRYQGGGRAFIESPEGKVLRSFGKPDVQQYTAGDDGVWVSNVFPGIHRKHVVQRSEIKTDWIIEDRPTHWPESGYLVFEDTISIGIDYYFVVEGSRQPIESLEDWYDKLYLHHADSGRVLTIEAPYIYDSSGETWERHPYPVQYHLTKIPQGYLMQVRTDLSWVMAPERVFPVVIDPRVIGSSTYNQGYMAFDFSPGCVPSNGCAYDMTVIVPGKSEIVHAWFDAEYVSKITQSCGSTQGVLCRKKDAGFSIAGPCNTTNWSCSQNLPVTTIPGLCYGDSVTGAFVNSVLCVKPACPDHELDFQMRNYHCSCPTSGCDTSCHIMYPGTWSVYVAARTLEGIIWQDMTVCPGDSISIDALGDWGVPPYTYSWQPVNDTTKTLQVAVDTPTMFVGTITDSCGVVVKDSAFIDIRPSPNLSLSRTNATCSNGSDGSASAIGGGTTPPYNYLWNTSPPQSGGTADSLSPGNYTVTVTDRYGCTAVDSIQVGYINAMGINATVTEISCFGENDGRIVLNPVGSPPFQYQWANGDTTAQRINLPPGTYAVTVTDAINCFDTFMITLTEPDSFMVEAGADVTTLAGDPVQLNAVIQPPGNNYILQWRPPGGLSSASVLDPVATPDSSTLYIIRVALSDQPDCYDEDSVWVEVVPSALLFVPTAFSPNGDGHNDIFYPRGEVIITNMQVFNRWGALVYEGLSGWDGTYNGEPQPVGTYMYQIYYQQTLGEEEFVEQGNVTLLR